MQSGSKVSKCYLRVLRTVGGILLSLTIFIVTLELASYVLLKFNYEAPYPWLTFRTKTWQEVELLSRNGSEEERRLAGLLIDWHSRHPVVDTPKKIDEELRSDAPGYPAESAKNSHLFSGRFILNANVDDVFTLKGKNTGRVKYQARYVLDKNHRRMTGEENKPNARTNLVFLGCSFTFGEGIEQEQTFPSLIGKKIPDLRVYNLGVPGLSPATMLNTLLKERWYSFNEIDPELPTIFIITFIDDHMRRVVGTSRYLSFSDYQITEPYFHLEDGKVKGGKSFGRDLFKWPLKFFGHSHMAKVSKLEFPLIGEYHYELMAGIYGEIRDRLQKKFPNSQFYISFFPGNVFYLEKLKPHFRMKGISYFEHGSFDLYQILNGHYDHGTDSHPSALLNDLYSELLISDLAKTHPPTIAQ